MKTNPLFIACFSLSFFLSPVFGCKAKKAITTQHPLADTLQRTLFFGEGGGFTGASHGWVLYDHGQLDSLDTDIHPAGHLGFVSSEIFENLVDKALGGLLENELNKPGNLYFYIIVKKGSEMRSATFAPDNLELNTLYQYIYKEVMDNRKTP